MAGLMNENAGSSDAKPKKKEKVTTYWEQVWHEKWMIYSLVKLLHFKNSKMCLPSLN
jgi:hypothetical protein